MTARSPHRAPVPAVTAPQAAVLEETVGPSEASDAALPARPPITLPAEAIAVQPIRTAPGAPASKSDPEVQVATGLSVFLWTVAVLVGIVAFVILVCCVYDVGRSWCHHAHFRACEKKLRRVHEAFLRERCEVSLCPFCVEPISKHASNSKVVFLCGHRFHTRCANAWFVDNPGSTTKCPICVDPQEEHRSGNKSSCDEDDACDYGHVDEAQKFILKSLHRRYPEFINKTLVRRWASVGTEIWLQELTFPGYKSFLKQLIRGDAGDTVDAIKCGQCGVGGGRK